MRSLVLAAMMLALAAGCKKSKPKQPDTDPPPAPAQPAGKGNTGGGGGGNVGIIPTPVGGGVVTNPGAVGGGGGGGAIQAVRKAARRTDALNEMNTLGQTISLMQNDLGRMPTKEQIVAELKQYPKLLAAINEGSFILTGTTQAGGLWAYEVDAENSGGIALIGGRAARSTADEVRQYLRGN